MLVLVCAGPSVRADEPFSTYENVQMFEARSQEDQPRHKLMRPRLLLPDGLSPGDLTERPFLFYRQWMNQKIPFLRVFFSLYFGLLPFYLIPVAIREELVEDYRARWIKNLGIGILIATLSMCLVAMLARLVLYDPLATALAAAVELISLVGLFIAARDLGSKAFYLLRLQSAIKNLWGQNLVILFIGCTALSLITIIPGFGAIPRLGNRMVSLVASAGFGAIAKFTWRKYLS